MKKKLCILKSFLDEKVVQFNNTAFIENDPISIPHRFSRLQDREIMGFFAATLAWGQRKTIIAKSLEIAMRFDNQPYEFILHHSPHDLQNLIGFTHRTFKDTDLLYFVDFLHRHYLSHESLETAFIPTNGFNDVESSLVHFEKYFFDSPYAPSRTRKHVATPAKKSACKRLNMFLRWMVRKDNCGVDFGVWNRFKAAQLICPVDLHVFKTAKLLSLVSRKQPDWQTALELTHNLRLLDRNDPVKYDFALFSLSVDKELSGL